MVEENKNILTIKPTELLKNYVHINLNSDINGCDIWFKILNEMQFCIFIFFYSVKSKFLIYVGSACKLFVQRAFCSRQTCKRKAIPVSFQPSF